MPLVCDDRFQVYKVAGMGPFNNNGYVLADPSSRECYLVDAPAEFGRLLTEAQGFHVKGVLITHTHPDHIAGYAELKRAAEGGLLGGVVGVHTADAPRLPEQPSFHLDHGDLLHIGQTPIRVLHTPGHTAGGVCLALDGCLISGDTLFPGGPGYTRSPEGFQQVVKGITEQLYGLDDDVLVVPGHGADTTIGESRREYAAFAAKPHPSDLHGEIHWLTS